jgi:hypothetical protein
VWTPLPLHLPLPLSLTPRSSSSGAATGGINTIAPAAVTLHVGSQGITLLYRVSRECSQERSPGPIGKCNDHQVVRGATATVAGALPGSGCTTFSSGIDNGAGADAGDCAGAVWWSYAQLLLVKEGTCARDKACVVLSIVDSTALPVSLAESADWWFLAEDERQVIGDSCAWAGVFFLKHIYENAGVHTCCS